MDNTTTMDHAEFTARRSLPMMALRGLTVFPGMMLTFEVERSMSIAALNMAMSDDQIIYLVPQKDIATDIPTPDDVYGVGTVCRIKQMMKQPGTKTIRVMAEGIERGRTLAVRTDMPCFVAEVEPMPAVEERKTARTEALIRHCCNLFDAFVTASGNMAPESVISVLGSTNAAFVSNFISQHVFLRPEEKQELLEETRPSRRLSKLSKMLLHETSVLGLQHQLEEAAQDRLNQTQQEYLLREQMKIIQAELGESDDPDSESADYREKILALHLPADSEQRLPKENRRSIHRRIDEVAQNRHVLNQNFVILAEGKHVRRKLDLHQARRVETAARLHERLDFIRGKKGIQRRQHHRQQNDHRRKRQQQPREDVLSFNAHQAKLLFLHPPHLNSARAPPAFAGRTARRTARTRSGRRNRPRPSPADNSACQTCCSCSFAGCKPSNPDTRPR